MIFDHDLERSVFEAAFGLRFPEYASVQQSLHRLWSVHI